MAKKRSTTQNPRLEALCEVLDEHAGRYRELRGAKDFGTYVETPGSGADEEVLTESVLAAIIERVLGFPKDAYFPQRGKGGLKPDFTPMDVIGHSFVFDAKGSEQNLAKHEDQIRRYMRQRSLGYGVLFNLREFRVYGSAPAKGHDETLSFKLLPLWRQARGEAIPTGEVDVFNQFCDAFSHRTMGMTEQIKHVRELPSWAGRIAQGEPVEVDIEFLVEQLRVLSRRLAEDAGAQRESLEDFLRYHAGREPKLLEELRLLALDIAPGTDLDALPSSIDGWAESNGLPGRVWRQYLLRVAYLALTRILLYRAWEDVDFAGSFLYDGGFGDAYERLSHDVRNVLDEAFLHGTGLYQWIYGQETNYQWYRPGEPILVQTLYRLSPFPLGKLDADVLGGLYQTYVEEIDRDRLGQFFTPRSVVRFMLDRAGFAGPEGVFRLEGDSRKPRLVLDFATGSGGFLVEAARRVIDDSGVDLDDPRAVKEALMAISSGFVGGEISPFPYYLTEINLLLQVSRLLGRLRIAGEKPPSFTLGVLHVDTLTAKGMRGSSLDALGAEHRADRAELESDERWDIVPLSGEKLETYRGLRRGLDSFDLIVGNPPYVAEANNKPLFDRLRSIHAWDGIYRGKTDYLYYFLLLAVEKLAPGGRLCVITPAGWMNAGAADFLREKLASELRLDELFLFGSYKLFAPEQGVAPTPTVESAILVATKEPATKGHKLRVVSLEEEDASSNPSRDALLAEMAKRAEGRQGRRGGIHVHDIRQSDLRPEYPWPIKHGAKDVAARVVAHLQRLLDGGLAGVEPLVGSWKVFQGIQTGADAYTKRIDTRLKSEDRAKLAALGARLGDWILELPPGTEKDAPWSDHASLLVRAPESRALLYGAMDDDDYTSLVVIRGGHPPDTVLSHLEKWRPLLSSRAEIARNPRRRWWEAAWPRDPADMAAPKVIALYRTDRGRFALDEIGDWQPSIKTTLAVGREADAPVAYLCGLLNSELLDLWYAVRGKTPRDVWRNYEPKRMNEMPYRRPQGDSRAEEVADLVRRIAANRRALLPHRSVVRNLGRIVKDPWKDGPVVVDRAALLAEVPKRETLSVRVDSALSVTGSGDARAKPIREGRKALLLRRGKTEVARIEGDPVRLDVLEEVLGGRATEDVEAVLLPKDLGEFEHLVVERAMLVTGLLSEGRRLVEEVERLVCALYDVPADLTDEVVAHAVGRAKRSA
jgi:hypothetical protein